MIADLDDDLSSLSIPAEDSAPASSPQEETKDGSSSSESQAEALPSSKGASTQSTSSGSVSTSTSGKPTKQTYPLYPSIVQLLHENGVPDSDADKIPASGPKGRLLKGDVLAYLGRISDSYPSNQSNRISKLGHLDLSNIQVAAPKEAPPSPPSSTPKITPQIPEAEPDTKVAVSISLKSVLEVQKRIQDTLGVTMPMSTFIARATEVANDDLPRSADYKPSADELFNRVLGLNKVDPKTFRGRYIPQITALPSSSPSRSSLRPSKEPDIIDILIGGPTKPKSKVPSAPTPVEVAVPPESVAAANVFSVSVAKGEEKQARVFLERVKTILQVEPGRLVI